MIQLSNTEISISIFDVPRVSVDSHELLEARDEERDVDEEDDYGNFPQLVLVHPVLKLNLHEVDVINLMLFPDLDQDARHECHIRQHEEYTEQ